MTPIDVTDEELEITATPWKSAAVRAEMDDSDGGGTGGGDTGSDGGESSDR